LDGTRWRDRQAPGYDAAMVHRIALATGDDPLVLAYARTRIEYRDPASGRDLVLHPEPRGRAGRWPFPGRAAAAVVTAWHPRSERGRPPEHDRADLEELRRLVLAGRLEPIDCIGRGDPADATPGVCTTRVLPADHAVPKARVEGSGVGDGHAEDAWSEPSLLVPGIPLAAARELAARFEQNAIFWWTPTDWRVVGVLLGMEDVVLGWSLSDRAG